MQKNVYIIVLNYNSWADTLACAESILGSDYQNFTLVIVDNASKDDSMRYIRMWAEGKLESWTPPYDPLRSFSIPPQRKPLDFTYIEHPDYIESTKRQSKVVLIASDENKGYSAGNNHGIRYASVQGDFDYLWILNNDTVIEKETLRKLLLCAETKEKVYGLISTTLLFYDAPDKIQAFGATFNPFVAVQKHNLAHVPYKPELIKSFDQTKLDYVIGASMLLRKECIDTIGYMPEEYFIYFEEIDIATKCKNSGYKFHICSDAIVYHKESASIDQIDQKASAFSDFYAMRNRVIFTKKYYPYLLPTVYIGLFISLLLRLKRGDKSGMKNILRVLKTPLSKIETLVYKQ